MFHNPYIASGGGDIFPIIIIIVAIIAQIIKAAKGQKPTITQPGHGQDTGGYNASEDELKKFLESLSGNIPDANTTKPPPLPAPVPKAEPPPLRTMQARRSVAVKNIQKEAAKELQTYEMLVSTREPAPASLQVSPLATPAVAKVAKVATSVLVHKRHPLRTMICGEIRGKESLRKAILLRDVLGPCIALRRPGNLPSGI
jgi:hypothetical protein